MKKLSRITLAKTYDVLSENEMKKVVGGMGSGSGSVPEDLVDCSTLGESACAGSCRVNSTTIGKCFYQDLGSDSACYCEHPLVWQ